METQTVASPQQVPAATPDNLGPQEGSADLERRLDALIEARLDAVEARRREAEHEALMTRFVAEHPDFPQLLADGSLETLKRANPLLDDVGAYFAFLLATERQEREAAVEAARKDAADAAEAGLRERLRAKGLARTLNASPATPGRCRGLDPDLAAPERFGGIHSVLAARLAARRQSAGV